MNEIDEALDILKNAILEDDLIVSFNNAKERIEADTFLKEAENDLKKIQKELTNNVMDKEKHAVLLAKYSELKSQYDNHPYVLNYNAHLAEVNDLLFELKTIIE